MRLDGIKPGSKVLAPGVDGEILIRVSERVGLMGMVFGVYGDFESYIRARNQAHGIPNIKVILGNPDGLCAETLDVHCVLSPGDDENAKSLDGKDQREAVPA